MDFLSASRMDSIKHPLFSKWVIKKYADDTVAWAYCNGLVKYSRPIDTESQKNENHVYMVPCCLFPYDVTHDLYKKSCDLALIFNGLVDRITCNIDWFLNRSSHLLECDTFTCRLVDIFRKVYVNGSNDEIIIPSYRNSRKIIRRDIKRDIRFHITRSDYMVEADVNGFGDELKQVEINTVAVALAGMSERLSAWHQASRFLSEDGCKRVMPETKNSPLFCIAKGLVAAHFEYVNENCTKSFPFKLTQCLNMDENIKLNVLMPTILMVVGDSEGNEFDQRQLQFCIESLLQEKKSDTLCGLVFRVTVQQLVEEMKSNFLFVTEENHMDCENMVKGGRLIRLLVNEGSEPTELYQSVEVSVVYFRHLYDPRHFDISSGMSVWDLRELLEMSNAVKVPSIPCHLAGMKKCQQLLTNDDTLCEFLEHSERKKIEACFVKQIDVYEAIMEGEESEQYSVLKDAMKHPENYVLKPQREGGGNNFYHDQLKAVLNTIIEGSKNGRSGTLDARQFILMKKIKCITHFTNIVGGGKSGMISEEAESELGVYGTFLVNGASHPIINEVAGHLVRTKPINVNESGITSGFGAMNSLRIV